MLFLGQTYMDNIDPFMKVLHAPSMMKIIREVKGNYHSLRHSMQALMLAISFAAIISLTDEEVSGRSLRFGILIWLIMFAEGPLELQH